MMKSYIGLLFVPVLTLLVLSANARADETKLGCKDVEATEAKCKEYAAETKNCETATDDVIKANEKKAKDEQEACKTKHGLKFALKCTAEIKKVTALRNTPRQVSASKIQKDLVKDPANACAKAEALGNATKVCKGPAAVLESMKKNCIQ
jgi:hypothetical protein